MGCRPTRNNWSVVVRNWKEKEKGQKEMIDKEYIEREKLIRHLEDEIEGCKIPAGSRANGKSVAYGTALGLKMASSFVRTLPVVDAVEIVRCKDCIHGSENADGSISCNCFMADSMPPTGFCSFGER